MLNFLKAGKLRVVSFSLFRISGVREKFLGLGDGGEEDVQDGEIRGEILFDYRGYLFVAGVLMDCTSRISQSWFGGIDMVFSVDLLVNLFYELK